MVRQNIPAALLLSKREIKHAHWLSGIFSVLLDVVGRRSLLGSILEQTQCEIDSLLESQGCAALTSDRTAA